MYTQITHYTGFISDGFSVEEVYLMTDRSSSPPADPDLSSSDILIFKDLAKLSERLKSGKFLLQFHRVES
jgi:hypothetical protein